jgi:cell division protein FtsL
MRHTTILFAFVAGVLSFGLFQLKYAVQDLEQEFTQINRAIVESRHSTHVLQAEWSYLNDPARLRVLAKRHLDLVPLMPNTLGYFSDLPERTAAEARTLSNPESARTAADLAQALIAGGPAR